MSAAQIDLTVNQYASFSEDWDFLDEDDQPYDNSGYTAEMQIRVTAATGGTPKHTLTSADGITLGGANGRISLYIPSTVTATFTAGATWRYDLHLIDDDDENNRIAMAMGDVVILPGVTR